MEKKEKILKVKLNETQEKILNEIIERTGLTKSEVVRYWIAFQGDIIPSGKEIQQLKRELTGIANNLNQIAKHLNANSRQGNDVSVIVFLRRAVNEVNKLIKALDAYKK